MRVLELGDGVSAPVHTERPRALNILLVADSLDAGGAERHVVGLAASLVRAGHAVTIGCSTGGVLTDVARGHGVVVRPLLSSLAKRRLSLPFVRQLRRLMARENFDLVHAHMYASAAAASLAAIGSSVPLVVTEHSEAAWRGGSARTLSRFIYWRAQRVIAVSEGIRRRLLEIDRVHPGHVTVIPNALPALDDSSFAPALALPCALEGRPLVGVVARLQRDKGVRYLVEAAVSVASELPQAAFVIVGDGPERAELERFAARLGVADRCFFVGFRADARKIISHFAVLAVPSLSEGTPLVVLEAMAEGVPIVASAVGGIPEQVRHEREALLVPPANAPALAAALRQLLLNPGRARLLGQNGRRRVGDCFSAEAMLRETWRVYHALVRA
ncbi:MAG: glycosyltransferase [Chloroflexota bacterium]|nr:glycosyltransferase [Chloroflexota bacterium]